MSAALIFHILVTVPQKELKHFSVTALRVLMDFLPLPALPWDIPPLLPMAQYPISAKVKAVISYPSNLSGVPTSPSLSLSLVWTPWTHTTISSPAPSPAAFDWAPWTTPGPGVSLALSGAIDGSLLPAPRSAFHVQPPWDCTLWWGHNLCWGHLSFELSICHRDAGSHSPLILSSSAFCSEQLQIASHNMYKSCLFFPSL